jgi:hypothetical protein
MIPRRRFPKMFIINLALITLAASCTTTRAGHGDSVSFGYTPAENPLIGEWREGENTRLFNADGTFTVHGGQNLQGAYLVRGSALVTLTGGSAVPVKSAFVIKGDTIELNNESGPAVYRRIKKEQSPETRTDAFSGKNWNAPHKNNMHDRWEFRRDGTFHFWHIHEGRPIDRGDYSYLVQDNILLALKEDLETLVIYTFEFQDEKSVTLTPLVPPGGKAVPYAWDPENL